MKIHVDVGRFRPPSFRKVEKNFLRIYLVFKGLQFTFIKLQCVALKQLDFLFLVDKKGCSDGNGNP
jgi:hypothetical protein